MCLRGRGISGLAVLLLMMGGLPLAAEEESQATEIAAEDARGAADDGSEVHFAGYATARWSGDELLYQTRFGDWRAASHILVTHEEGAFTNQAGKRVEYVAGDVLFNTRTLGWFKSHPGDRELAVADGEEFSPSDQTLPPDADSRALIAAVRATGAQSVAGKFDPEIYEMAMRYAQKMARQGAQDGHAGWDRRFQYLLSQGGGGRYPSEITAESWNDLGPSAEAHARSCVEAWQQSPGHNADMMRYHGRYGYAMARGRNGVCYGVGIFAN